MAILGHAASAEDGSAMLTSYYYDGMIYRV